MKPSNLLAVTVVVCLAVAGVVVWWLWGGNGRAGTGGPGSTPVAAAPELPAPESPFRNAAAGYTGSATCAECHQEQAGSHDQTQHALALRGVDVFPERPAGGCQHEFSQRRYEVYFDSQQRMRHRELIRDSQGEPIVLEDLAPTLAVGSGAHALTYLVERDGFYLESPITWYRAKGGWGMSPGYDKLEAPPGFSRMASATCMNCHTGGVEPLDEGPFRFAIREPAIGCERCHGPGELHVRKHRDVDSAGASEQDAAEDDTIVHPARLSRERLDAICAQCHLESAARVRHRGRPKGSFRPGHRFTDHELAFQLAGGAEEMKVVGHVEQMRLSKCYQQSEMTCVTCHHPHERPPAERRMEHFREKCLECHQVASCGLEHARRLEQTAEDNCMQCHMPQGAVDIVHVAFTHHRIGIHGQPETGEPKRDSEEAGELSRLSLIHDASHLPPVDIDRALAIAYLELAANQATRRRAEEYGQRSRQLLEKVRAAGLVDGDVEASLARVNFADGKLSEAVRDAKSALSRESLSPPKRIDALEVLAQVYLGQPNYPVARSYFQQLCKLRRSADDWRELAACRFETGDTDGAVKAAQKACEISPYRADLAYELSDLHFDLGHQAESKRFERRAKALEQAAKR